MSSEAEADADAERLAGDTAAASSVAAALEAAALSTETLRVADRRLSRAVLIPLIALSAVALMALGFAAKSLWDSATTWDPLGQYQVQQVTDRLPGFDRPAVRLSVGVVQVVGQKCNLDDEPVRVRGNKAWYSIEPPGSAVGDPGSDPVVAAERLPGCNEKRYSNPIPPEVAARVVAIAQLDGTIETVWVIAGEESPIDDDGSEGVPRQWSTINFAIVCDLPECVKRG